MIPLIYKLRHGSELTDEDEEILTRLVGAARQVERGDILPEGTKPKAIVLITRGWACRYKLLANGRRQITALFMPGDICEPFGSLPQVMDHALAALTPVLFAAISAQALRDVAGTRPRIGQALWWDLLLGDAMGREHMVSLGRRSAVERLGYLFCEIHVRLTMVGLADGSSFEFPLTQTDLADMVGLTAVHVNRSLQDLRAGGLISLRDRRLTIHHVQALRELSMFDPTCFRQEHTIRN